ncbi:luciferin 4-monooxygenase-like isoform X2 [Lutzomyia longipalpis]|uniref:luciferin 4-monooxygenase-like isoform X2 n=1 Tax=Lutzomyia longipalpis TaxID=7200 RepID=UPI00248341E2|nr:luciferin 4-monooxygenase-like isoform X2 [Lutzomyia longipalpis]
MSTTKYYSEEKLWRGPPHPASLFNDRANLGRIILSIIDRDPHKVAQISDNNGIQMTNQEIALKAKNIAGGLRRRGCKVGDVVGFVAGNGHNLVPTLIACFLLEAPVNAMDIKQNEDEIYAIFIITKPKFIFCDDKRLEDVKNVVKRMETSPTIIVFGANNSDYINIENLMKEGDSEDLKREIYEESCKENQMKYQIIVCSSGTTGPPKAVAIPYQSLLDPHWSSMISSSSTDCYFSFCSPFWSVYYIVLFSNLILGITRIITTEPVNHELFLQIVKKYKVTHVLISPVYISNILDSPDLTSSSLLTLKYIWSGGSVLTEEVAKNCMKYISAGSLIVTYGMSETGTIARNPYYPDFGPHNQGMVSVGNVLPGIEGIVLDEEGKRLGPEETGQVCFRVPYPIVEYLENPEATAQFIDSDGFAHTGDLGFFDKDGFLYITGRSKDIIKYIMYHVSGSEIERVVKTHPNVSEVVAVGIPDRTYHQLPAVLVVLEKGSTATSEEISNLVSEKLPDTHKLRGGVYFVEELPKTYSGKIKKNEAKTIAEELSKQNGKL